MILLKMPHFDSENIKHHLIEKYSNEKISNLYIDNNDEFVVNRSKESWVLSNPKHFFSSVFLPHGYPSSVSSDYFSYQLYDTIQAFCSRITGTLTTKSILKSIGVGDASATPLAAAISWIFKDGTGMFGSIIFAWWKGTDFDSNCKKWRLFADILNDSAMFVEMFLPKLPGTTSFLCLTTAMKAGVGVSGSATRAAITQHQAIKSNMADVSAKDGSQETAVNLLASFFALLVLTLIPPESYDWYLFYSFTLLHLLANYKAVKSLKFYTLNTARYDILLKNYFENNTVLDPDTVNEKEPVILGFGKKQFNFDISMGKSLSQAIHDCSNPTFDQIYKIYWKKRYILIPNIGKRKIDVVLFENETPKIVLEAYFNAVLLSLAIEMENNTLTDDVKNTYIEKELKKVLNNDEAKTEKILETMIAVLELVGKKNIIEKLEANNWKTDSHSLKVDQWRLQTKK